MLFKCEMAWNPTSQGHGGVRGESALGGASDVWCRLGGGFHSGVLVTETLEIGWNLQQAPPRAGSLQTKH